MVVMSKQNVPALRLEGFDSEWESHTLGDISNMYQPHTISSVDLLDAGIPVFGANGFIGFYHKANHFADEVTISVRGEKTGTPNLVEGPSWITGNSMVVSVESGQVDKYYLYAAFCSRPLKKFVTGGAQPQLTRGTLKHVFISLPPTLEEQQAIGAIFTNLDAVINQHTLKHKALQQSKTALMQRMFPQEGQTVPELRLEGFSGEWCIKSLDELATVKSAARVHREQWRDSGVPFFRASDVSAVVNGVKNEKAFISHELYEELSAKSGKLRKGDLLVIGGGSIGTTYQVPNDGPLYSKDADVLWVQPNANVSSDYLETFFGSLLFEKYLKSISHAGTIAHYTIIQAKRTLVPTPPTLAEQQAIGAVFTQLDTLIAAEAQYIESLKQAKTALLQRMFI